jgi:hypothetical protein
MQGLLLVVSCPESPGAASTEDFPLLRLYLFQTHLFSLYPK